jgi:magnesium-transporting ATPase (P-type)
MNAPERSLVRDAPWHAQPEEAVLARLSAEADGLPAAEAAARLASHGPNALPAAASRSALRRFAEQFNNVLIYVLLASGGITLLLGHEVDAAVIFGVVVVNAIIGFVQEGKAERALEAVRSMLASRALVRRRIDGRSQRLEIDAAELVPGDVVVLTCGDRVPADLRLLRSKNLRIEEAALTGESVPVDKSVDAVGVQAPLGDRQCMAYSGTVVTYGQGTGVVVETGPRTEIGRIGALVSGVQTLATPLTRRLDQFARRVTAFVLAASAVTFAFGVLVHGFALGEMFLAVVGLAVAAIPEGLPAIVTITLALGTQRMAQRNAVVRRLPAVETLGSVTVICSDKTGTLTRNEMTVVEVVTPRRDVQVSGVGYAPAGGFACAGQALDQAGAADLMEFARCALLCNDAVLAHADGIWTLSGDPTEGALLTLALKAGLDPAAERADWPRIDEVPFESEHRFMATLHHDHQRGVLRTYLKGAPERVLELCAAGGDGRPLDRAAWEARIEQAARAGQRVLALAVREEPPGTDSLALERVTGGFCLLGLAGMMDPPRAESIDAVARCRAGGVRVKMITGDHAVTAAAIGRELGLADERALTGTDLDSLDDAQLRSALARTDVIARASPEHKLRLIAALQADGHVVAMTGDGANDAPALKRADIGVAMGRKGTAAAREAADIVLTDDNFASIANAVAEGRTIYDNIKKSLLFILPTNGGQAAVIVLAVFLGIALPVTAAQILWINMVTTVTLALSLAFEPAEPGVMRRPPRPPSEPLITRPLLLRVVFVSALMMLGAFIAFEWQLGRSGSMEAARTAAVNVLVAGQVAYLFSSRRYVAHSLDLQALIGNRVALYASGGLVLLQLAFTYAPPMQALFRTAPLDAQAWLLIVALALLKFLLIEAEKWLLRQRGVQRL